MLHRAPVVLLALSCAFFSTTALADSSSVEADLDGYYRVRAVRITDPDLSPSSQPNVQSYFRHRVRLNPHIYINEYISAHFQGDALDDQIWGANPGNVLTQSTADQSANFILKRAYGEVLTPVGVARVGRMGSHWGKGLLSNDGDGFRNEFGDAHFGDTYDRVLFATKPMGKDGPLTTALLYDKIVETDFSGVTTTAALKGDVDEVGLVVHYQKDWLTAGVYGIYRWQSKTDTTAYIPDVYAKIETEKFHWDAEVVMILGKTKGVTGFFVKGQELQGKAIDRFTLATPTTDIKMVGGASEIGFKPIDKLDLALEAGYASGDKGGTDAFSDGELTAFSFDADYNVGLIMFEFANRIRTANELAAALATFRTPTPKLGGRSLSQVCASSCANRTDYPTASLAQEDFLNSTIEAFVPSNGAVKNALYVFPKVRFEPVADLKMVFGVLWAMSNQEVATRQVADDPDTQFITETDASRIYGLEFDYGISYSYTENFHIGLQAGYFRPGGIFERANGEQAPSIYLIEPRFTVTF